MNSLRDVRQQNARRVLASLLRSGPATRAELARRLSLTRSTISSLVQALHDSGMTHDVSNTPGNMAGNTAGNTDRVTAGNTTNDTASSKMGRPGLSVDINPTGACFVGAEIGVDTLSVDVIDLSAHSIARRSCRHDNQATTPTATISRLITLVEETLNEIPAKPQPLAASIALPGFVDDAGVCIANELGWHNLPFRELLENLVQDSVLAPVTVLLENDANACAIAELYDRMRQEDAYADDIAVAYLGYGVGAGLVQGGQLFRGRRRGAGELGHLPMFTGLPGDQHEQRLEKLLGKRAILALWRAEGHTDTDLSALATALKRGDPVAERVMAEWSVWLIRGLAALACLLEPQRIVLCGELAQLCAANLEAIQHKLSEKLGAGYPVPTVEVSRLDNAIVAFGAACLAHQGLLDGSLVDEIVPTHALSV